jgi:hypothetical protein
MGIKNRYYTFVLDFCISFSYSDSSSFSELLSPVQPLVWIEIYFFSGQDIRIYCINLLIPFTNILICTKEDRFMSSKLFNHVVMFSQI